MSVKRITYSATTLLSPSFNENMSIKRLTLIKRGLLNEVSVDCSYFRLYKTVFCLLCIGCSGQATFTVPIMTLLHMPKLNLYICNFLSSMYFETFEPKIIETFEPKNH